MTEPIRKLGRYELLEQLATGGMGKIYLARTRGAGGFEKHLIIKTILPHLAEQEEFVTKFLDEGRIVVQLTHGNIVPVFDMGEQNGEYYIAMEYVPGLDLRAILKRLEARGERLDVGLALFIGCELCKGLGYAHRKTDDEGNHLGIVHRDVSPSNVLVSEEGEVKIIDFGIARAAGKVAETATGHIQGKCCYMSPEQARGKPLDARSDIFSAGVLLYEMLTLHRPFEGRSDLESLELVRQCDADPPGVLRPAIPERVDEIVGRAMQRDPDDRYQTIDELHVDLQREMHRLGETVTSQQLADELTEVFEQGPDDQQAETRPANLDEALQAQLDELAEGPGESTPAKTPFELAHTATAADSNTQTLSSSSQQPSGTQQSSAANQPSSSNQPPTGEEGETTGETPGVSVPSAFAPLQSDATPSTGSAEHVPATGQAPLVMRRRHLVALMVAVVAVSAGVATAMALFDGDDEPEQATLQLDSDPSGAQVLLDGDELAGETTPTELILEPGSHQLQLKRENYEPLPPLRVRLEPGEHRTLDADELVLDPEQPAERHFTVVADPEQANIYADGEPLDSSPAEVTLREDDIVNLSASAEGCETQHYTLPFQHRDDEVSLNLECDDEDEPDDTDDDPELHAGGEGPDTPVARRVRIDTEPAGADVFVDGERAGESPLRAQLDVDTDTTIEVHHEGYETYRTTTRPADIPGSRLELQLERREQGCINFRAMHPANNEIAINGEWLDGRHMRLENHPLPAGENTITVRHPDRGPDTFEVEVEPGDDCAVLTVWQDDDWHEE